MVLLRLEPLEGEEPLEVGLEAGRSLELLQDRDQAVMGPLAVKEARPPPGVPAPAPDA